MRLLLKGRLYHRFRDGEAGLNANLDDYVFMIWGLIELYEATFNIEYLEQAIEFNNVVVKHFSDVNAGGFFFTADDSEELPVRKKESYDGAIPSGNSIAMLNLLKLGRITADANYEKTAYLLSRQFSESVQNSPSAFSQMLSAVDFALGPSSEIIIAGSKKSADTKSMLLELTKVFSPNKIVIDILRSL